MALAQWFAIHRRASTVARVCSCSHWATVASRYACFHSGRVRRSGPNYTSAPFNGWAALPESWFSTTKRGMTSFVEREAVDDQSRVDVVAENREHLASSPVDPAALPRVEVVFHLRQCDKNNHGWCEGPPLTVACQVSICWPGLLPPGKVNSNEKRISRHAVPRRLASFQHWPVIFSYTEANLLNPGRFNFFQTRNLSPQTHASGPE